MTWIRRKIKRAQELGFSETRALVGRKMRKSLGLLPTVPPTVYIELTNRCNLNCIMCDRESMIRKQGLIDMGLFQKIIDNAAEIRVPEVKLNRFGEPLLHPSLAKMIEYAKSKGILRVYFTSNATLLTEARSREIIEAGLDSITFSVDGATAETYEKVRGIPDYSKIVGNIERFAEMRSRLGRSRPNIVLNTILMEETEPEILSVFKKWKPIVDKINILPVASYGSVEKLSSVKRDTGQVRFRPCHHLFDRLMVFWDGVATVCCGDINGELQIGRFPEERLESLWKNDRMTRLRRLHRAREIEELPVCLACDGVNEEIFNRMQQQREEAYSRAEEMGY